MKYKYLLGTLALSFWANAASIIPIPSDFLPPPAPATVTATMGSGTAVDISWSPAANIKSYQIRKNLNVIATLNPFTFSFRDTNVSINTDTYQVRACINACSAWKDATRIFDSALWRLASQQDRHTLTLDSETKVLKGEDYIGVKNQYWRITPESAGSSKVKIKLEDTQTCLASVNNNAVSLANCNTVVTGIATSLSIETKSPRTEEKPGTYYIRVDSSRCILPNTTSIPSVGACNSSALWYIEPVGYGERPLAAASKFTAKGLLIVKPSTQFIDAQHGIDAQGTLPQDMIDASQESFKTGVKFWLERITDGQVTWSGASVVAKEPIRSLNYETVTNESSSGTVRYSNPITQQIFFWDKATSRFVAAPANFESSGEAAKYLDIGFLPFSAHLPNDVQRFVPRGAYDSVQVFFTGGTVNSGSGGTTEGINPKTNYAIWSVINNMPWHPASNWLSRTSSVPTELFIHEMMHGLDAHYGAMGLPLPTCGLHGCDLYGEDKGRVGPGPESWIHWYRDYWLGTVIAPDGTYRGYGSRMFKLETVRSFAARQASSTIKITHASSGKCLATKNGAVDPVAGMEIVFSANCNTAASSFLVRPNGMLEFKGNSISGTGFCVPPNGGTAVIGSRLVLWPACTDPVLPVQLTDQGSIQNIQTGLCIVPNGGSSIPADGTNAVYWSECNSEVVRFKFNRL